MAEQEKTFLKFLLQASTRQAKLLLQNITPKQLAALGEVCFNLLHGDVEDEVRKELKTFRNIIRQLGDRQLSQKSRKEAAVRRASAVVQILRLVEDLLP